jgi:hypothetical protein
LSSVKIMEKPKQKKFEGRRALGDDAGRRRRGFVVISRDNFDSLFDSYFF